MNAYISILRNAANVGSFWRCSDFYSSNMFSVTWSWKILYYWPHKCKNTRHKQRQYMHGRMINSVPLNDCIDFNTHHPWCYPHSRWPLTTLSILNCDSDYRREIHLRFVAILDNALNDERFQDIQQTDQRNSRFQIPDRKKSPFARRL